MPGPRRKRSALEAPDPRAEDRPILPRTAASGRLTAAAAASRLGVRRDTLYAYVSRGLIRSERQQGTRERLYHAEDVDLLMRRREGRRDPARAAEEALHWGSPLLESELTLIADGRLYFRGYPAEQLAASSTFEDVVNLLWGLDPDDRLPKGELSLPPAWETLEPIARALPPIERFQMVLAAASAHDPAAYDTSLGAARRTGAKILRLLAAVAVGVAPSDRPIAQVLQEGWAPRRPGARRAIEAALILWADHELNVGTFTARCVASARATPYAAVIAGLSALSGNLHGATTEQVEALFDEIEKPERARAVLEARLRRGERLPGFGHWLYPEGDPRAVAVLERARTAAPGRHALANAILTETESLIGRRPNIDFATVSLRRALKLPPHSAMALTAVARCAGWIAHVLEQYATGRLIRPRARYTGRPPIES